MVDIDPALDTKLRAFFEHIEASPAPPGLTNVDVTAPARGRRSINLLAGVAAAAVVAGSVAVFAIALRSHDGSRRFDDASGLAVHVDAAAVVRVGTQDDAHAGRRRHPRVGT